MLLTWTVVSSNVANKDCLRDKWRETRTDKHW